MLSDTTAKDDTIIAEIEGALYVYRCHESHDAIAVNRWRRGPKGGLTADGIARMSVPGPYCKASQAELNDYALKFAAAPDMFEALLNLWNAVETYAPDLPGVDEAQAALAKARGMSA